MAKTIEQRFEALQISQRVAANRLLSPGLSETDRQKTEQRLTLLELLADQMAERYLAKISTTVQPS